VVIALGKPTRFSMHSMGYLVRGSGRRDGASGFITTFVMLVAILQNFGISGVAAAYYNNCSTTVTVTRTVDDRNPYGAHERTTTKTVTATVPTTTTYTKTVPVPTTIVSTTTVRGSGVITTTKTTTETATKTVYVTMSEDYGDYGGYGKTTVYRTVTK